jgi:hypothetical protein
MYSPKRLGGLGLLVCILWVLCRPAGAQDAELQKKINHAIDQGADYLKSLQTGSGHWTYPLHDTGMTALAAWTLLETGVSADDPAVQKAAAALRKDMIAQNETYALALAVIFFDRLKDSVDEPLIQALGARLLGGQNALGGWDYKSVTPSAADQDTLRQLMSQAQKDKETGTQRNEGKLAPEVARMVERYKSAKVNPYGGDNSNTQFAMIGLWVARRHKLPVDDALKRVERRFRAGQRERGRWTYYAGFGETRPSMTCAGLLGLALGHGVKRKKGEPPLDPNKDQQVRGGLEAMDVYLTDPQYQRAFQNNGYYYFLFSLERMAVVYDLKKVGKTEWYVWGAKQLVEKQNSQGAWQGIHGAADTCFALLFLKRANVAKDLTLDLQNLIESPGIKKPIIKKPKKEEREPLLDDIPKAKDPKKPKAEKSSRLRFLNTGDAVYVSRSPHPSPARRIGVGGAQGGGPAPIVISFTQSRDCGVQAKRGWLHEKTQPAAPKRLFRQGTRERET